MKHFIIFSLLLLPSLIHAQKTDKKLQHQVESLVKGFNGDIGIYIHNLKHNSIATINADTVFPTASIVKISILTGIMDKIRKNELEYHQQLVYRDSLLYAGEDILGSFKEGEKIKLSKVMMLMLTTSDNTASLWLQSLAGGGSRINEILDSLGFKATRVNSRTSGREANRNLYGWGQTSPREMENFMNRIVQKNILDTAASDKMLRLLSRQYWDEQAISQVPPGIFIADKNGAVDESRSEIMYVNNGKNPYILSVFTKNNKDQSWQDSNEAWVLTRKLSALLWKYFN
ncbi:MAG: serine hydrolase [Ferruginibacter sp.]|uniref:serine hydrolase n=1 Tax=Ferruginibacter sp. TaxID=1940288 RepID=UPI0026595908|nr:serine hydrolase [Ferruginibacter sp.]MDB5277043.1 serine hydrolase [Ferruginibacter sp.]